jgi:hypothetical protein
MLYGEIIAVPSDIHTEHCNILMFLVPYILVIYVRLEVQRDAHGFFLCILYYTILALHVSGAICTHHQEHKLQSTAVGPRDCYGVLEVG